MDNSIKNVKLFPEILVGFLPGIAAQVSRVHGRIVASPSGENPSRQAFNEFVCVGTTVNTPKPQKWLAKYF